MNPENLSFSEAMKIASAALTSLSEAGQKANICVVNVDRRSLVQFSMDETRPSTAHVANLKAKLSAHTGRRTRSLRDEFKNPESDLTPAVLGIKKEEEVPWAGGVPIYVKKGNEKVLIGGIGISNLSENDDEKHAIRAVEVPGYISDRN
jgi:uncharacterized protein GlcG (DUF336 family)